MKAAQAANDDDLVDTLASRYATRISWARLWGRNKEADADDKTLGADDRIAISELRRIFDFDRHSR